MSRIAAIDTAVRLQLAADGRRIEYGKPMNRLRSEANDNENGYSEATFRTFLANVADRLRLDDPALVLPWAGVDAAKCLADALPMVIKTIDNAILRAKPA